MIFYHPYQSVAMPKRYHRVKDQVFDVIQGVLSSKYSIVDRDDQLFINDEYAARFCVTGVNARVYVVRLPTNLEFFRMKMPLAQMPRIRKLALTLRKKLDIDVMYHVLDE